MTYEKFHKLILKISGDCLNYKLSKMKKAYIIASLLFFVSIGFAQKKVVVKFKLDASSIKGVTRMGIRGSKFPLTWEKSLYLEDNNKDGIFEVELNFPNESDVLEYKYVYDDKTLIWELETQNRFLTLGDTHVQTNDIWNVITSYDVNKIPKISAEKAKEDFLVCKKALLQIHPGLYRYNTKSQIDSIFNYFEHVFSQPLSYRQAFLNFTKLTSALKCGHTFPSFYNQGSFIQEIVLNQKDKLPFAFRVFDERIFITQSVADNLFIPYGTEILAINKIPTQVILKEVANLVKADGSNNGKRFSDLNTFGLNGFFEMFDCYFPMLYPPVNNQYTITLKKPGNQNAEIIEVTTITRVQRATALKARNPTHITKPDELWKFELWDKNTAYLQLGTFDVFQLTFEWKDFLRESFKEIRNKRVSNLVIDIRWNEGGQDEVLFYIAQNIAAKTVKITKRVDLVRYSKISNELRPYLFTWDSSYFNISSKVKAYNEDYYQFFANTIEEIKPLKSAFKGNTYLLVNGSNSSATFYFAEYAKENNLATLLGETTGGSQKGLNAGGIFFLRLPNSNIEIDIPIIGSFSNNKPNSGIVPDFLVYETVDDLLNRRDPVKEKVKELILINKK